MRKKELRVGWSALSRKNRCSISDNNLDGKKEEEKYIYIFFKSVPLAIFSNPVKK